MKIEEGSFRKTRDGRKAGPMKRSTENDYEWCGLISGVVRIFQEDGTHGGTRYVPNNPLLDLIAEWKDEPTGPVTIETVKRINTGTFKRVHVTPINDDFVSLHLQGQTFNATELRDISELATQLADALEGK